MGRLEVGGRIWVGDVQLTLAQFPHQATTGEISQRSAASTSRSSTRNSPASSESIPIANVTRRIQEEHETWKVARQEKLAKLQAQLQRLEHHMQADAQIADNHPAKEHQSSVLGQQSLDILAAQQADLQRQREQLKILQTKLDAERESFTVHRDTELNTFQATRTELDLQQAKLDSERQQFEASRTRLAAARQQLDADRMHMDTETKRIEAASAAVDATRRQVNTDRCQLDQTRCVAERTSAVGSRSLDVSG